MEMDAVAERDSVRTDPGGAGEAPAALAIGAHPDDIEFMMAGTLILLQRAGWAIHCMNLGDGRCGTGAGTVDEIVATRQAEARQACRLIGAEHHSSIAADLQIYHDTQTVAKVVAVIRRVRPRVLLLHSPSDYMEDHVNACRIGVTAAFARGMAHFPSIPETPPVSGDVTVYHALPYGLRDPLRRPVRAGQYVNVSEVMDLKRAALAAHASQKQWLQASQGVSYLEAMVDFCRQAGKISGRFEYAEGWQRRSHLGFSRQDGDPLAQALGERCMTDADSEASGRLP